jgi:predicted MFS family arabinose efflux permease
VNTATEPQAGISRKLVVLLSFATGATVANMYYAQPLLHTLGRAFHVGTGTSGLLVTFAQIGYVIGLALLVPLGDLVERRALITNAMFLVAIGQAVACIAPDLAVFAVAITFVGVATFAAQVIVPMSSHLAAEHERGKVVGTVMSGLLIGVLCSRTLSGVLAGLFGWRSVFGVAAASMLVMSLVLRRVLPKVAPTSSLPYREALTSVLTLVRHEPILRQRMVLGACAMGCFSVLWTALSFLLSGVHGSHYHYSNTVIGLFGLAGLAGASAAQVVGRLADRGHGKLATTATLILLLVSWLVLYVGKGPVLVLIIGIMVLDLGVQGTQIGNQAAIYQLHPDARSRLTTAYMVAYFLGGVALSSVTGVLYASDGWGAVCILGAATAAVGLVTWIATARLAVTPVRHHETELSAAS